MTGQHPVLQAPLAHAALFALAVAPLIVAVPANFNIIATAALTVLVGAWRSVKPEPPLESMTKKVGCSLLCPFSYADANDGTRSTRRVASAASDARPPCVTLHASRTP